jgi:hypothetical protein
MDAKIATELENRIVTWLDAYRRRGTQDDCRSLRQQCGASCERSAKKCAAGNSFS